MRKNKVTLAGIVACIAIITLTIFSISGCGLKQLQVAIPPSETNLGECVVLIHGMGRTVDSMTAMQNFLTESGYYTVGLDYPSTKEDIDTIVKNYVPPAIKRCNEFNPKAIHFVTHSLGGIVLRQVIAEKRPGNLGRVVMLSPPNHGSQVVDRIKNWWIYEWTMGPAGQQLSTGPNSFPLKLERADFAVGIITGDQHAFWDSWFAHLIPGRDDGKVSVESAKLAGMKDFVVVSESHSFIMNSANVQEQVIYFLKNEKFKK